MSPPTQPASDHSDRAEACLTKLRRANRPLSKSALFGRTGRASDQVQLAKLLATGDVVNLARGPVMALATREDACGRFSPLQLASKAVLGHLGLSLKPLSLSASGLASVRVPAFVRPSLRQAVAALVTHGQVVPVKMGRLRCVVATAGIQHHLAQQAHAPLLASQSAVAMPATAEAQAGVPQPIQLSAQTVRHAYAQVLPAFATMVEIGAIQRYLGCDLAALHATLRQMLQAEQIYLVQGEPTLLADGDQAAGLPVAGITYYCIELCQG